MIRMIGAFKASGQRKRRAKYSNYSKVKATVPYMHNIYVIIEKTKSSTSMTIQPPPPILLILLAARKDLWENRSIGSRALIKDYHSSPSTSATYISCDIYFSRLIFSIAIPHTMVRNARSSATQIIGNCLNCKFMLSYVHD